MSAPKGTIVVTGANGGLGTAIVQSIVARPELAAYHGVYTVRDVATATSLQSALQASKSHPHNILPLDLSKLSSVREAAAAINAKVSAGAIPRTRALILNAGYREPQGQTQTESGLDIAFASNYLGHWLLVLLLLQSMDWELGRVVIIGGWVHE
jgi:NAD(P)-dependent dehydrogenase (short-subunit alcohol dehydrogenase family)